MRKYLDFTQIPLECPPKSNLHPNSTLETPVLPTSVEPLHPPPFRPQAKLVKKPKVPKPTSKTNMLNPNMKKKREKMPGINSSIR